MKFQVISRKYRPQRFDEIIGQPHICSTLQNSIKSGRIFHSYLFTGSRGIGKTSTARILAKTLNCSQSQDFNPCNECQNCLEITGGRNIDVLEIDGASNRGIDQIRELRENVKYPPANSHYRIFIIDEVHMLTKEAFNALLKTLEEPPPHVVFIFATTEPQKIPATILSRCQRYDFHRIPATLIIEHLSRIAGLESVEIPEDILLLIAKKSDGSMRDAESILDQVISFSEKALNISDVQKILGLIDNDYFFRIAELIRKKERAALIESAGKIFNEGIDVGEFLTGFAEHYRNLLITLTVGNTALLDLPANVKKLYEDSAGEWNSGDLLRSIKIVSEAQTSLKKAENRRMHLEFTLLRMAAMEDTVTVQQLLDRIDNAHLARHEEEPKITKTIDLFSKPLASKQAPTETLPKMPESKPVPAGQDSQKNNEDSVAIAEISIGDIRRDWNKIITHIEQSDPSVANFLRNGLPHSIHNNILELSFHETAAFHRNGIRKRAPVVEKALKEIFHRTYTVQCIVSNENSVAMPDTKVLDDMTQTIIDAFDGELII